MEEKIKVKDFIEKKLKDLAFRKIYEKIRNQSLVWSMQSILMS